MVSWRDRILEEFTPQVARLTLAADPDGLLVEEGILQGIRERGFELIPFEDHVAFRFAYESRYRSRWDRGELTDLVVVLRAAAQDLGSLPYDLLQAGRKLCFSLGDLFPNLSYPVLDLLGRGDLDALFHAQAQFQPGKLGDNATKDFALRHVFDIVPGLIQQAPELLRVLLRRHYRSQRIPAVLDERFVQLLRQNGRFEDWPLERIVPDRNAFLGFLQERWPIFVQRLSATDAQAVHEAPAAYNLEYTGPSQIPFDHDDIRVYIDNLFLDGLLRPVSCLDVCVLTRPWIAVGLRTDPAADRWRRFDGLMRSAEDSVPGAGARHQDWLTFAQRWAELIVLWHEVEAAGGAEEKQKLCGLQAKVDAAFWAWVQDRYPGLHNQPALPPVMLHHVPRALARLCEHSGKVKVALVLLDGLALDQWVVLRDVLAQQRPSLRLHEEAVFAWLPTITPVSRQSAFSGRLPLYFPTSIHTTAKEKALWTQFWLDQGFASVEVDYARALGDDASLSVVEDVLSHPKLRVVGLVVDKVDKIMHGMQLGTAGMHNQVRQWAVQGFTAGLFDRLLDRGFTVFLASDHGNIEARGCGRLSEGAIADVRGERVRVYSASILRKHAREHFPGAIEWPPVGLPEDYLSLFAPARSAFVREGERTVSHGGVSLEEVVVPFIRVEGQAA